MTFDFAEDVFLFMKGNIVGEGGSEVADILKEGDRRGPREAVPER